MNKYFNYNKIKLIAVMGMLLSFSSCLKKDNIPEISKVAPVIEFPLGGPGLVKNSLSAFSTDLVDTVIALNIASPDPLSKDVIVTIKNDPAVVADYNSANGTSYVAPSAAQVEIASTQITIKAGYRVGLVKVKIKYPLFDPTKSYMLGLSITDAQGMIISGNFGKFLWAFIVKNPLEGTYLRNFYRWNGTQDTTTAPNSTVTLNVPTSVATVTGNSVLLPESYIQTFVGSTAGVTLSFTTTGGVLGNFSVSYDATTTAGLAAGGFTIVTPPKLVSYTISGNAGNLYAGSVFRIYLVLINSGGNTRTLIDSFVKQ
jgi:hypothetical protein